jgi:hypothetical protein
MFEILLRKPFRGGSAARHNAPACRDAEKVAFGRTAQAWSTAICEVGDDPMLESVGNVEEVYVTPIFPIEPNTSSLL